MSRKLRFICSDMWKAYLKASRYRGVCAAGHEHPRSIPHRGQASIGHSILVRRQEVSRLQVNGKEAVLTKTKWILLKRRKKLTRRQRSRFHELMECNLRSVRAYIMKESFQHIWSYLLPTRAGRFLDLWCRDVMRSNIEPMRGRWPINCDPHRELILNYFRARRALSSGVVEGMNNKAKLTSRRHYGFRGDLTRETALFHVLGGLPEPDLGHKFT